MFNLYDLEEFLSTDLNCPDEEKPPIELPNEEADALDLTDLYGIIPRPHIHPSAFSLKPFEPVHAVPYRHSEPVLITPHSLPLAPAPPYSRYSWLVPVRGVLPWDGSTPAVVLHSSIQLPQPPTSGDIRDPIKWTHPCLQAFWSFLLSLRDSRSVGLIGLSFHATRPPAPHLNPSLHRSPERVHSASTGPGSYAIRPQLQQISVTAPSLLIAPRAGLSSVDYVKVYHQGPCAMYVRNALHVWSYTFNPDLEATREGKIRLLKGARLVLLDERSKGILIS